MQLVQGHSAVIIDYSIRYCAVMSETAANCRMLTLKVPQAMFTRCTCDFNSLQILHMLILLLIAFNEMLYMTLTLSLQ